MKSMGIGSVFSLLGGKVIKMKNENQSVLNVSLPCALSPTTKGKWSKWDQFGDGQQRRCVSGQVSAVGKVKRIQEHHDNWKKNWAVWWRCCCAGLLRQLFC